MDLSPQQINFHQAIFNWCLRNGHRSLLRNHLIQSTKWCSLAAEVAGYGCGWLASAELEALLLKVAQKLPMPTTPPPRPSGPRRWLHVLTEDHLIGGHTALVKHWIESDPRSDCHNVVVLAKEYRDLEAEALHSAAKATGGETIALGELYARPLECVTALRQLAWAKSDFVVLHTHMWDVLAPLAFGITGGPPVLFMNMADHLFGVGVSVADLMLHLRPQGELLSARHRGIDRSAPLPIPLIERRGDAADTMGSDLRQQLGIPLDALVLLTIGRVAKYEPRDSLDFLQTAKEILSQISGAYLIAVGPSTEHPAWQKAFQETNGKLLPVGEHPDLKPYHACADIYLEGFPIGSLTALLEAGLSGLPCVRVPKTVPSIFKSSGPAVDHLPEPEEPSDYVKMVVELARLGRKTLREQGNELATKIKGYHCGTGWSRHLMDIKLPESHKTYAVSPIIPMPENLAKFARYIEGDALGNVLFSAHRLGLGLPIDLELASDAIRHHFFVKMTRDVFSATYRKPAIPMKKYIS